MARGYGKDSKSGQRKFRGGSQTKRETRGGGGKPSKNFDSRKTHDTSRRGSGGKPGRAS